MTGLVADGRCVWVSNEGPRVLPQVAATGPLPGPGPLFVLGVDGRAVAHAHGHGRTLDWLPDRRSCSAASTSPSASRKRHSASRTPRYS